VLDQGGEALFTYSDMADDVIALMDHFVVSKAHIAGASMGGQITTLVGVRHPARYSFSTFIVNLFVVTSLFFCVVLFMGRVPALMTTMLSGVSR